MIDYPHSSYRIFWKTKIIKEFKYAVEKLRAAYFANTTNFAAIKQANSAFLSDCWIGDSVLKAAVLHAQANTRHPDKSQHKNTFLMR